MKDIAAGTDLIASGISQINGLRLVAKPDSNLVAFTSDTVPLWHLADEMRTRGWFIQPQLSFKKIPATLHISVNPQAVKNGPRMLKDLEEACGVVLKGMPTFSAEVQQAKDLVSRAPNGQCN
uniref:Uncharacterized protein n=1 Tax=Oxyrrhis marina TaxID=2969 RepID=A0A7S3UJK8_OXYMA